ncbi:magnesium and cobalt transport protein CorA [Cetobacterium somerae ATCC BAA-474]|uniref:Magnesium transport protein CorA n=1 Tax=Cetobacterium somerae ATCC BAA-474 TaxID=1319815 RepID=U7V3H3_9FUSO|nr:magnesium/cobalt transporter CorA [Cetobacterium somerae]ERT66105.1 magnesium and cobalt transport protein CorA [Cetobacterium somerae ATCC BAA-474]
MNKKVGLQPGTLVYTGDRQSTIEIPITHYTYNHESFKKNSFIFRDNLFIELHPSHVNWLNIGGIHNTELIKKVGEAFNIDSLILEDLLNNSQRPKLEIRDDYIFITLKMISHSNKKNKYEYEQISFILFSNLLITFQENPFDVFDSIRCRIEKRSGRLRTKKEGYLTYSLIDRIVDNYFVIIEDLEERIDDLEDKVTTEPKKEDFDEILELKKELLKFRRALAPLKEVSSKFKDSDIQEYLGEDIDIYLRDLQDHIIIANESNDALFNRGNELLQLYHSTISTGMNEIMKVLTMISSIFIPLSFLAGLYGMNFQYMPELTWKYGYFFILSLMISIILGTAYFFKKKKWW